MWKRSDIESDESDMESAYSENEDFDMEININNSIRPDTNDFFSRLELEM